MVDMIAPRHRQDRRRDKGHGRAQFHTGAAVACVVLAQACTSYGPQLQPLAPEDRVRVVADSPFAVATAGLDRVPTGSCRATQLTGRVLEVRGGMVVVGGSPTVVAAPGTACDVSPIAIIVAPPDTREVEVRRPDSAKTVWALSAAAFTVALIAAALRAMFPET